MTLLLLGRVGCFLSNVVAWEPHSHAWASQNGHNITFSWRAWALPMSKEKQHYKEMEENDSIKGHGVKKCRNE